MSALDVEFRISISECREADFPKDGRLAGAGGTGNVGRDTPLMRFVGEHTKTKRLFCIRAESIFLHRFNLDSGANRLHRPVMITSLCTPPPETMRRLTSVIGAMKVKKRRGQLFLW